MSQEQRDSYVIPPNFIEGGSFFGGLFKARNVVEAVILAAGTGLPILTLSLTLTVRIILLCLTSLPLALLALIGIVGMPLSSYIILFFRFLRNRRSLSKSGGKSSRKQSILPTWDKKSGPSTAVQPAAYKKDGSRIRFAKDTRRLMLDTAYRQKKQAARPGNPLAAYVPIQKIENGIVYTTDHRFIKILEIVPINFLLRSAREQRNIVYSFISYLKIAPVKLQIKVITKRADMNRHIETVRREMARETNESCRMQQEDYLKLLKKLGSREAIARRFFLIMEYEPLPGAKKDREEADAISSLQTAARTAANYLRQCGNSVVQHENEDEAAAEMLYTFLCRRESTDIPFLQRISHITSNYIKSGCSIDEIPVGDFFAPSQLDFTHGSYLCIDGTYYAYLLVPSDGYKSEVPAGWLSLLVNAGDGIDLDVFLTRQPKDRMIRKLGQQLRINRSKIKETSDTNTDFDDLDSAIRSGYFLKDGLSNHEDFYYLNLLITVTADNPDDLDWKCAEMKKLLISQDMDVQSCNFCQEQALRSSFPLVKLDKSLFERSKRNVLTLGAASCYPFTAYELCDDNGILLGVNKHNNSLTRKQRCRSTPMIGRRPIAAAGIFMICTACIRTQTPPPLHPAASRKRRVSLFSPPAPSLATALHAESIRSRAHTLKSHIRLAVMQTIMSVISATTSSTLALTPIRVTALVVTVPVPARTAAAIRGCCKVNRRLPAPAMATEAILVPAVRPRTKPSMQADTTIAMARGSSIRPVSTGAQVPAETAARRTMIMPATV